MPQTIETLYEGMIKETTVGNNNPQDFSQIHINKIEELKQGIETTVMPLLLKVIQLCNYEDSSKEEIQKTTRTIRDVLRSYMR